MDEEGFQGVDYGELSDEELQEAFAAGRLKPGLNIPTEEKTFKNNQEGLKAKLKEIKSKLGWIEKMSVISKPAPLTSGLLRELRDEEKEKVVQLKTITRVPISTGGETVALHDFKRELLFHRQAQSAVLEGFKKLDDLGIPTLRPEDYFAEMAKSDDHMQKVRKNLAAKQAGAVRAERVAKIRHLKKIGRQTQIENKLKQQSDKKKMLEELKKYRKGIRKDLDFLENKPANKNQGKKKKNPKREEKDARYGFGGQKKDTKKNSSKKFRSSKSKKNSAKAQKRLGKSRRKSLRR